MGKVLAPRASVTRDGSLKSNVQDHDFYFILFSLFMFFIFWGRQKRGFCSYVSSIAMRNSDLRSSLESMKVMQGVDFRLLNGSFSPIKVKRDR